MYLSFRDAGEGAFTRERKQKQLEKADARLARQHADVVAALNERRQGLLHSFSAKQEQRRLAETSAVARHTADRTRWQDMERQELRVELALKAKADAARLARNAAAAADAAEGVGRFETTLRQMGKDAPAVELEVSGPLPPLDADPLAHIQKIRRMLPEPKLLAESGAAYLAKIGRAHV